MNEQSSFINDPQGGVFIAEYALIVERPAAQADTEVNGYLWRVSRTPEEGRGHWKESRWNKKYIWMQGDRHWRIQAEEQGSVSC